MAAAVLRSSVAMAFRRTRTAASSAASSSTTRAAPARSYYHGHGHGHGQFDAAAYSPDAAKPPDKGDGFFGLVPWVGSVAFIWLMDADYHFWGARHAVVGTPRMTPRRGR